MSAKRCPLCGEPVSGEECFSCGYIFPDFEKLSAPYDLDPSNDLFGAAGEEEISSSSLLDMDALDTSGIPVLKTAAEEKKEAAGRARNMQNAQNAAAFRSAQANAVPNIQVRPNAAPPAVAPQRAVPQQNSPYAQPQYPQQPAQYNNFSAGNVGTGIVRSVVDFVTAHWWQFLLMFIMPSAGIIFSLFYFGMSKFDKKFERTVLGAVFMVLSLIMVAKGIDFFGIDRYFWLLFD